jgi:hypothetical protein
MGSSLKTKKLHHEYRRARGLARSLHARIYASVDQRLLIVGGRPKFEQLVDCLTRIREVPALGRVPNPSELGFPTFCDGELTAHGLQTRSRALTKWSLLLDSETRRSKPNKRRTIQILAERREIDALRERLSQLHEWRRRAQTGTAPQGTPFLLDAHKERFLAEALGASSLHGHLPPLVGWFARFVVWATGENALMHFLDGVSPLAKPSAELQQVAVVRTFIRQLHIWKRRSRNERPQFVHTELRNTVKMIPPRLVTKGHLTSRLRGRSFEEHCDVLIERCTKLLAFFRDVPAQRVPAAVAALVSCDGGATVVPKRLVTRCLETGDYQEFDQAIRALFEEVGSKSYRNLLLALEDLKELPSPDHYSYVREMLAGGATHEDLEWAQSKNLLYWFHSRYPKVSWMRSFLETIEQREICLDYRGIVTVLDCARGAKEVAVFDWFARWLSHFSPMTFSPRNRKLIAKAIVELVAPGITRLACHDRLRSWATPSSTIRSLSLARQTCLRTVAKWLGGIAYYQEIVGDRPSLPKSIGKLVGSGEAHRSERDFLRNAVHTGTANASQRARLAHLEKNTASPTELSPARLRRTTEEVFLKVAIDALREILSQTAAQQWQNMTNRSLPSLSLASRLSFAKWAVDMDDDQRQCLCQILKAYDTHGVSYKQHLPANKKWLKKAIRHGVLLNAWYDCEPHRGTVAGREVRIAVVQDPVQVFLMGSYFNTCLSLGNCNEMSVLANAHDANKQVIFMRDSDGKVLARQLVAVSQGFGFTGYHCYVGIDRRDTAGRNLYISAMASYCGRWARRCGLSLVDSGEPETISDLFWYDDGVHEWHAAANMAWAAEDRAINPQPYVEPATASSRMPIMA